ncbi:MAG: hypothetical protein ACREJC_14195 [Tepidisphaeraceae bacterium]
MVAKIEDNIWNRVIEPSWDQLSHDAAEAILKLRFAQTDMERMDQLADRARQGTLSGDEQDELDAYTRIGRMVSILQSKARRALHVSQG